MYSVSEQQIDYILNDIRRNGVEMEDLQLNLLDHVCCIIEQNLKDGDDFESFYQKTIQQFYKKQLWEIEEETITLLTFKNYYAMKKSMIVSGTVSVGALLCGSFFKIMHWPGANALLVFGITLMSFAFLPLMFLLKNKELNNKRDKLITGIGVLMGMMLCMSTLFKIMHWPGASVLWISTSAVSIFVFIPIYFFSGIRKPETKVNTIVTTIILIGATGLLFTLTSLRKSRQLTNLFMYDYLRNEQLISMLQSKSPKPSTIAAEIQNACAKTKSFVLEDALDVNTIPSDFESKNLVLLEGSLGPSFQENGRGEKLLGDLKTLIEKYNAGGSKISLENTIFDNSKGNYFIYSNMAMLSSLTQIQLLVAGNELNATSEPK